MLNITAIEDALYTWLNGVTGESVVIADSLGPELPAPPYSTIKIMNVIDIGTEEVQAPDNAGVRNSVSLHEINVSFQFFGPNALQKAHEAVVTLGQENGAISLDAAGISFYRNEAVNDISEVVRTNTEKRAVFEATFGARTATTEDAGLIETVNASGDVEGGQTTHTISISQSSP